MASRGLKLMVTGQCQGSMWLVWPRSLIEDSFLFWSYFLVTEAFEACFHFDPRYAMLAWVLAVVMHPSVCLSITCRWRVKMAKHRITQTMLHDSSGTLVFWRQISHWYLNGITPMKAPNAAGVGKICIFLLVDKSPGLDASLPNICLHLPRHSISTWTSWRNNTMCSHTN